MPKAAIPAAVWHFCFERAKFIEVLCPRISPLPIEAKIFSSSKRPQFRLGFACRSVFRPLIGGGGPPAAFLRGFSNCDRIGKVNMYQLRFPKSARRLFPASVTLALVLAQ